MVAAQNPALGAGAGRGSDSPALAPVAGRIPSDTKIAHLNGNQWGFGWNAGILYELDKNNRYALTFKGNYSSAKLTLKATTVAIFPSL
ncbi:Long-chain fatty acid transport protein [Salmonella enterica subsp. enterica serovar Montevideo str. S5-403]|uniref:Long-chain fatty acid transport protein n=1 Tax=Salmonella enterica subsp. enterica serovar Montevideo str. S5-403 TaxID=913242 RepID=G5Q5H6_SALMO|nr:Long-chain fatty acid transport protein [Salmonella enterica subsp. enterica serovar Montevideo str. S5-403]